MKRIVIYVGLILCGSTLFGQDNQLSFSIREARDYALQHNKTLLNASRDLQMADAQKRESLAGGLPQVSATVDYMTNFNYEFDIFGGMPIVMEDQASANLTVSQLIFSGQYWVGLQLANIAKTIAEKNYSLSELEVKENVSNTYYLILVSERLLEIVTENKNNLQEIYIHTSDMYKVGMAEQTDVDQIKISLSQLENSMKEMERNLQLNYNMLRILLSIDGNQDVHLTEDLMELVRNAENNVLGEVEFDINANPSYQIIATQEELGEKKLNLEKWAYAPTVAGYYSYKEKILTSSFDLSPKNAAGLTMSIPIFSGGTRKAKVDQARIDLDKIVTSKELAQEQLELQDKQLTYELKNVYENYLNQKENVEVAKRVFTSFNNKYKHGVVSSLELTQANSNYLQAESNYVSSIMKLLQAKLKLDKLYNTL